ncbi:MAG: hypothetical protein HYW07_03775 [Candidatus Latescibacteria bacterium]|nr:hypothetical protein [Candidatus Latescibacterota bacterium]
MAPSSCPLPGLCSFGFSLLLLSSCYDAPRTNPFDPALTPPVELQAALDDTAGIVFLTWSRYEGRQPFKEYRVLRNIAERTRVDTLARLPVAEETHFLDGTIAPDLDYLYRVEAVNQADFAAPSIAVLVSAFSVRGIDLLGAQGNDRQGTIALRWQRYRGPDFAGYQVWRRSFGEESRSLAAISAVADSVWTDTTALPGKDYTYWIRTAAAGKELVSGQLEAGYELPRVELQRAEFSSATATAALSWTAYQGPRFAAYQVRRRTAGTVETTVEEIPEADRTTYADSALDGNTEYAYRLFVRTTWGEDTGVFSNEQRGLFYALSETVQLPEVANSEIQAVSLALDEQDRLYTAATLISTTTARLMQKGISLGFPDLPGYRSFFGNITPDRLSPVQLAAGQGKLYAAVRTDEGKVMVGSVNEALKQEWATLAETEGAFPVGLYVEGNGEVLMVDSQGLVHRFDSTGNLIETDTGLQASLETDQALPLRHMAVGQGTGLGEGEMFFLLAPDRDGNHAIGRTRTRLGARQIFGGRSVFFTDGVGSEEGQTLSPLVLAFDRSRTRLMVLEAQGRLQVFDARPEKVPRRYLTKWGRFGRDEGEFQISPPTAVSMVVDGQGRIYVADGEGRVQIFAP